MKNEKLYREAIEIAVDAEERFLEANEVNKSFNDLVLQDKHYHIKVVPAASIACAQQELIAELFGVSEEKVHEDLARAILARDAGKGVME